VFPVHGVGGFTGLLLTAVFSATAFGGLGLDDGVGIGAQLGRQLVGALATTIWCGVATYAILKAINAIIKIRVAPEQETEGLDLSMHEERGYSL
jgi:Amt family ammonium transporter